MKRRSFLRYLAASSASLAFPSIVSAGTLGLNGKISPSNRITLGHIGLGSQGAGLLGGTLGNKEIQVVAACDVDRERRLKAAQRIEDRYAEEKASGTFKGCFNTGDYRELLARSDIDALSIALPDHWHALPVIQAAQAGKDMYAEKPLALTIPEGRAMVNAVERSGVVCQIGSMQRSGGGFRTAWEFVRNGMLGKITEVQVGLPAGAGANIQAPMAPQTIPDGFDYEMWLGPAPWAPYYKERCFYQFRWIFDYSGGQLTDWIGHHYDIAAWATGVSETGPVEIRNATAKFPNGPLYNTAEQYSFEAHYANGVVIKVASKGFKGGVTFIGTEGTIFVDRGGIEFDPIGLRYAPIPSSGFKLDRVEHLQNFVDCVRSRQTPCCPVHEAQRTVSVAHLANACFRSGRSGLRWDPAQEKVIDAPDAERLLTRAYRSPWQLPV